MCSRKSLLCILVASMMKDSNFKKFKIMKFTFKIIFYHVLPSITLMITFEDLNLIFYILVFNTKIEVVVKNNPI
jgi:hypothetical protein